jgi:prophage regulatory protein
MRQILRVDKVSAGLDCGISTVYEHVASGLLPPPVKIGPRASGWIEDEIDAVVEARIAGASDSDVRDLVARLIAARPKPHNRAGQVAESQQIDAIAASPERQFAASRRRLTHTKKPGAKAAAAGLLSVSTKQSKTR